MKLYAKIHFRIWLWLLPVVAGIYSVYSFSQTDPNQVFFSQSWYWQFQKFMWRLGFQERLWSVGIYSLIILIWFRDGRLIASGESGLWFSNANLFFEKSGFACLSWANNSHYLIDCIKFPEIAFSIPWNKHSSTKCQTLFKFNPAVFEIS